MINELNGGNGINGGGIAGKQRGEHLRDSNELAYSGHQVLTSVQMRKHRGSPLCGSFQAISILFFSAFSVGSSEP